ncbi:hypothetical protein ZWY2020_050519 [Hordeum vulgare]|nr:hypothetical protein ZWY2020_050519 [Hordeum vulgare]
MEIKPELFLVACLLLGISNKGTAATCRTSDIVVQTESWPDPAGTPVYYVNLVNNCGCTQNNVKLACPGFNSSVEVYPAAAIRPDGDGKLCSLYSGAPVRPKQTIFFNYRYTSTKFSFEPVSSTIVC